MGLRLDLFERVEFSAELIPVGGVECLKGKYIALLLRVVVRKIVGPRQI